MGYAKRGQSENERPRKRQNNRREHRRWRRCSFPGSLWKKAGELLLNPGKDRMLFAVVLKGAERPEGSGPERIPVEAGTAGCLGLVAKKKDNTGCHTTAPKHDEHEGCAVLSALSVMGSLQEIGSG
jgi:hypothetical protein